MIINRPTLTRISKVVASSCAGLILLSAANVQAAVTLESSTKIADNALHFDGGKTSGSGLSTQQLIDDTKYHFYFGGAISAHGDAVKTYKHYVFMTWYRGGKDDRHVMLSRLNTKTGVVKHIEFPHQHSGYQGKWYIGESHNTIGLAVSPKNGTIHMVYDMHAYGDKSVPGNKYGELDTYPHEPFLNDFFRYSYSHVGAAEVADEDFTLEKQFIPDTSGHEVTAIDEGKADYKHLVMTGNIDDKLNFAGLTYPKFSETKEGDLFHYMRWGGNNNGAYYYNQYDASNEKWSKFVPFSEKDQKKCADVNYNWGLYGYMKYVNGKLRVAFQKRSSNNNDKYLYQNGIYYAYLDDPENNVWRDHAGKQITWPLCNAEEIKIFEPGDLPEIKTTQTGKVYIVGGFDWTMTEKGDLHVIHKVKDNEFNKTVYGHLYKPAGAEDFIHVNGVSGAETLYTAGNDVYLIGLKDNKPYVSKATGGTGEFTQIYTDTTTSIKFEHGVAYIKNGKVYYYLMERKETGITTENPLHLQVIDLGITSTVNFGDNKTSFAQGDDISFSATVSNVDANSVEKIGLYLDDTLVSELTSAPYQWTNSDKLKNLAPGKYRLTLKAKLASETIETTKEITVVDPKPTVQLATNNSVLQEGYTLISFNVTATTTIAGRSIAKVALYVNDELVSEDSSAPYTWSQSSAKLKGLTAGSYTIKAVATDNKGATAEHSVTVTVQAKTDEDEPKKKSSGGGGTSTPLLMAVLALFAVRRKYR